MVLPRRRGSWSRLLLCSLVGFLGCSGAPDDDGASSTASDRAAANSESTDSDAFDAQNFFQQGQASLEEGAFESAVEAFTQIILHGSGHDSAMASLSTQALVKRGDAFMQMGFPDTAIEDYSEAIRMRPHDSLIYAQRGRAHLEMEDLYSALEDCTQAIRMAPENAEAYRVRGVAYLRRGKYARSVADFNEAKSLDVGLADAIDQQLAEAYYAWSRKSLESGDEETAEQKLALARELGPAYVEEQEQAAESAVAAMKPFIPEPGPDSPEGLRAKPVISDEQTRRLEALEYFANGEKKLVERDLQEALVEFTSALALSPDLVEGYAARCEVWLELGFADNALLDVNDAILKSGGTADLYRLQAKAFLAQGSYYRAIDSAGESLRKDPTDAATYGIRGRAYLARGMHDEAIKNLEYALKLDDELAGPIKSTLEEAYLQRTAARAEPDGDSDSAVDDVARAEKP